MSDKANTRATYRFALYGRSGSGKTCLLAALAMNRNANPAGYTCDRLPVELPRPHGEPAHWDGDSKAASLHVAADWLDTAIEKINSGDVPAPNPPLDNVMTFCFDFTSPDHRTFRIELVDYSGELVNTSDLSNPESLTTQLKKHMLEMDGILVVAEAPKAGDTDRPLGEELHRLSQAFASLRGDKQDAAALNAPVALLVNKWDRQSDVSQTTVAAEEEKLANFFGNSGASTHQRLYDAVSNGVCRGNFKAFPVSAFGPSEVSSVEDREIERPTTTRPLNSFGLEDGFVWLARRRDELDLAAYEKKVGRRSGIGVHLPLLPDQYVRDGKRLAKRFPTGSIEHQRTKRGLSRARRCWWSRQLVTVVGSALCALGIETGMDHVTWMRGEAVAADPGAPITAVAEHESWLEDYYASPPYRHSVYKLARLSPDDAFDALQAIRRSHVEKDWQRVEEKDDLFDRAKAASEHLVSYSNSPYRETAQNYQDAADAARERRENEAWLQSTNGDVSQVIDVRQLTDLLEKLDNIPFPARESETEFQARIERRTNVSNRLNEVVSRIEWDEFVSEYNLLMSEKQYISAGTQLSERYGREQATHGQVNEEFKDLAARFRKQAESGLQHMIRDYIRDYRWPEAYELLDRCSREIAQWPTDLRWSDHVEFTASQRAIVEAAHDKHLYTQFSRKRTTSSARTYMQSAPLKAMRTEVERYQSWLSMQNNSLDLKIVLERIEWGKTAQHANDNRVVVKVNEKKIAEKTGVTSRANSTTGEIVAHKLKKKLDDFVTVSVKIVEEDSWLSFTGGDDDHGSGTASVRVRDLLNGYTLPLTSPRYRHEAIFRAHGMESEPALPPWRRT